MQKTDSNFIITKKNTKERVVCTLSGNLRPNQLRPCFLFVPSKRVLRVTTSYLFFYYKLSRNLIHFPSLYSLQTLEWAMDRQTGRHDSSAAVQPDAAVLVAVHDGDTIINNDTKVQWFTTFHALTIFFFFLF